MSPLAFDKEGQPFEFLPVTVSLLVRRWRNPGGRGTCEQVLDDHGDPLHVEPTDTVPELREAVNHVPGLYRLDQCGEDGNVIPGTPAAYIAIDPSRNAGPSGSADPLLVVRDLAQVNAEVSKTLATSAAGMMSAATENMKVAIGGGLGNRRLLALLAQAGQSLDGDEGEDDDENDDGGEASPIPPPPEGPGPIDPWALLATFAPMLKPILPKVGEAIGVKLAEFLNTFMGTHPAASSVSMSASPSSLALGPAPGASSSSGGAAGSGSGASIPTGAPPSDAPASPIGSAHAAPDTAVPPPTAEPTAPTDVPPASAEPATALAKVTASPAPTASTTEVRNASPTGEQIAHLLAIRGQLTSREVAIVDQVIARMDAPTRASWLAELSGMTVDRAAARVRSMIPAASRKATDVRSEP